MTHVDCASGSRIGRNLRYDLSFELVGENGDYPLEVDEVNSGESRIMSPKKLAWLNCVPVQFIIRSNVAMGYSPIFSNRADGVMRPEATTYDQILSNVPSGQVVSHPITCNGVLELIHDDEPRIVRVSFLHTLGERMLG